MFREVTSRQLVLDVLGLLNKVRLVESESINPPLYEITALLNINNSLLSGACGKAKPSAPTIRNIIQIIMGCREGELKTKLVSLFKEFFNIWKMEIKYINPYLEELVQKC